MSARAFAMAAVSVLVCMVTILGASPDGARAQTVPGNVTYDRVVAPLDVTVGDTVHVKIELDYDNVRTSRGVDTFLVVDRTPTMFGSKTDQTTFIAATKEGLIGFVNSVDFSKGKVGLITYAANATVSRNLTDDRDSVLQAIQTIRMSEENDVRGLQDAFRTATQKLDNDGAPGNDKNIFIVVAGPDQQQALLNMATVTQAARNAGVRVVFLMFTGAAYAHYVDASSQCSWGYCVNWSDYGRRYAWEVAAGGTYDIRTVLRNLSEHFLFSPSLAQILVRDEFDPANIALLPDSVVPLPSRTVGPPFFLAEWQIDNPTRGPFVIEYDVRAEYPDDTYPVSTVSRLYLIASDGQTSTIDLPNPPITVHGPGTPGTPASPTAPTPGPTTPPATTEVPTTPPPSLTPSTATPSPTSTGGLPSARIYLPVAQRRGR
jgi:hypothetical protein